jgi:hypothetical protein
LLQFTLKRPFNRGGARQCLTILFFFENGRTRQSSWKMCAKFSRIGVSRAPQWGCSTDDIANKCSTVAPDRSKPAGLVGLNLNASALLVSGPDTKVAGGEGGIRTPDRLAPMPHFECGAFDHSATSPGAIRAKQRAPRGRAEF